MSLIVYAAQLAAELHRGQTRKYNGRPYITHPCRVAGRVAIHPLANDIMVAAAYLHDVLEDCDISLLQLREKVHPNVVELVRWLTNPSKGSPLPRAKRKWLDRQHIAEAPRAAKIIKLIDRIDNLTELDHSDSSFVALYCDESESLLDAIGRDADPELHDELAKLIDATRQLL